MRELISFPCFPTACTIPLAFPTYHTAITAQQHPGFLRMPPRDSSSPPGTPSTNTSASISPPPATIRQCVSRWANGTPCWFTNAPQWVMRAGRWEFWRARIIRHCETLQTIHPTLDPICEEHKAVAVKTFDPEIPHTGSGVHLE